MIVKKMATKACPCPSRQTRLQVQATGDTVTTNAVSREEPLMKNLYLAGLDIGTTGAKAMIFDVAGTPLASAYNEYPCTYPRPNWVEQDAAALVDATMKSLRLAVEKSRVAAKDIAAVSLSAQRCCGIFLDEKEQMLRPMISWQDNRTPEEVKEIAAGMEEKRYYGITGFPNSTTWLLSKMMWVRRNEPEVWKKTRRVVQMHDYFLRALGAGDYYVDMNDAGFFGCYDTVKFRWDPDILKAFSIPENILPVPAASSTVVGKVSAEAAARCGLAEGTPIAVGAGDQSAGALGAGVVRHGFISVSMGTAGAAVAFVEKPFRDPNGRMMVTNHPQKGRWLLEGYQAAAAGVYRWFRDELGTLEKAFAGSVGKDPFELINEEAAAVPAGSRGLVFLPYFASAATPRYNSDARGVLAGLTFAHNRGCLARSFMEGITMDMMDMIQGIVKAGVAVEKVRILGGPTRSELWNQIQCDVYGIPVQTLKVPDATVLGAAVMAGAGAGVFSSIAEGAEKMVQVVKSYTPDPKNVEVYRQLYKTYCQVYDAMDTSGSFAAISAAQK
jgi:xylulokinase